MRFTLIETATGRVLASGDADDTSLLAGPGETLMEGVRHPDGWIEAGTFHAMPPRASPTDQFDWEAKQWIDPRRDADFARAARQQRNLLLQACDWTQGADTPLAPSLQAEWAAYRSALRQVPEQPGFPRSIAWPEPP